MDNKPLEYHIPKGWVISLFCYYAIIILAGIAFLLFILISKMDVVLEPGTIRNYTYCVSILSSAMMTGIRYSQKLYKACIDGRVFYENDSKPKLMGNVVYFLLRPFYSVAFAVIFVICLIGGMKFLNGGMDCVINERTVYLSAIVSAFIGYFIGKVLDMFEFVSKDRVDRIM